MDRNLCLTRQRRAVCLALGLLLVANRQARAQEKPEGAQKETSKVASVEVTPARAAGSLGEKIQFQATAKDAAGNPLPDKVTLWYAAPFDLGGAEQDGIVTLMVPGELIVGAVIGGKTGYAHVAISRPHIACIDVPAFSSPLLAGSSAQLQATPRNPNGDPRTDIALTWSSDNPSVASIDAAGLVRGLKPGRAKVRAAGDGASGETTVSVAANSVRHFSVEPAAAQGRTGDVLHFAARAADAAGKTVSALTQWSVAGGGAQVWPDGAFVAERPGTYIVQATLGGHTASTSVTIAPRNVARELEIVGRAMPKEIQFAEEWVWGNHLYFSTISDKVLVYDISDPAHPKQTDTLQVDARLINDVSVTPDGKTGVLTREGASSRKNGIVFFDASDADHPKVISEYTATVTGGVHSAFLNSHYVYLTDDATGSLRVIDFADVKAPREVARWQTDTSLQLQVQTERGVQTAGRYLHDVQVADGLAYLAYWRDGLVILDVGNGMKGGRPEDPKFVSRVPFNYNELYGPGWLAGAHAVYRYKNYVFVGDEVFPSHFDLGSKARIPVRGIAHVVDVSDLEHPRETATYSVSEAGSHNIWVFDDVLYMGYYNGGGRVVDVSGELRGELYSQGREIARLWTGDPEGFRPNLPFVWGAYPHKGLIYVNDIHSGLWVVKLGKPKEYSSTTEMPQ